MRRECIDTIEALKHLGKTGLVRVDLMRINDHLGYWKLTPFQE